jgi:hypothetical protein
MIQEIFFHRFNNNYLLNKYIGEKDIVLHYNGNSLLLKTSGEFEIPQKRIFQESQIKQEIHFYLHLMMFRVFLYGIG